MSNLVKAIGVRTVKPFMSWYLRKPRKFRYDSIAVRVVPGVFHPGLFYSSKQLLGFISREDLAGKKVLEVGSGSGLISIYASRKGASVTAVDISLDAVTCTSDNARRNKCEIVILQSDLFGKVPAGVFDFILVNPPYYRKDPASPAEHAWNAGKDLGYFTRFFQQAKSFVHKASRILMVLSDECDLGEIQKIAENAGWYWQLAEEKKNLFGRGYIINITRADSPIA